MQHNLPLYICIIGQKVGRVGANGDVSLHHPNAAGVKSGWREMPYKMDRGN